MEESRATGRGAMENNEVSSERVGDSVGWKFEVRVHVVWYVCLRFYFHFYRAYSFSVLNTRC